MKTIFACSFLIFFTYIAEPAGAQNTFIVDTWDDREDLNPGNGLCYTIHGECSLRAAIEEANAIANNGEPDVILFTDIPILSWFALISLQDPLPAITDPVIIDGTTANGEVILDGNDITATGFIDGITLEVGSGGSTIEGLSIGNFDGHLIFIKSNYNVIVNNRLGTLSDGTDMGSLQAGVFVLGNDNDIGRINEGNVIGFNGQGIYLFTGSTSNTIRGNHIGTDETGRNLGNEYGIEVLYSDNNRIGGGLFGQGNTIGFSTFAGIDLTNSNDNIIRNNYIGTNAEASNLGNGTTGILSRHGTNNKFGGLTDYGNVIGFNGTSGISISYSDEHIIQGNFIGTHRNGENIGNLGPGIKMDTSNPNTYIGYTADDLFPINTPKSNHIAYNGAAGIVLNGLNVNTTVRGNSIYDNDEIGIDLGDDEVTLNDDDDADEGPNDFLNYPDVTRAFYRPGSDEIVVEYSISSDDAIVSYPLTVDVYLADDPTSGEGKTYIGRDFYLSSSVADTFKVDAGSVTWAPEDYVVLTTTDADGNTSEFSPPAGELGNGPGSVAAFGDSDVIHFDVGESDTSMDTIDRFPTIDAYPNPFNPLTTIALTLEETGPVSISVHDMLGRQVSLLHDGELSTGMTHNFTFDGAGLASGTYLLRVKGREFVETKRLMLLK